MEENHIKNPQPIDLRVILKKIWNNKRLFYKTLPIVFVLSCIYIFSLPRYYKSNTKLAPEMESMNAGGSLSSLASTFGFDLGNMQTTDAITPMLYPDLMDDNGFVSNLLSIRVKSQEGDINTTYHDYLQKYQKKAWWIYPVNWVKSLLPKNKEASGSNGTYDPYNVSKKEDGIMGAARNNISIAIDKKTGVISIETQAQDPLICKTLTDSIKDKLQIFITDYRTNKSRIDYEYYKELTAEAKSEYEKIRRQYASMADASTNISLRSVELKLEDIENDMQLKLNAYTTLNNQLQAAKAKVQERTPAFTVIKGASVPIKPAGPKRMFFVLGMLILSVIVVSLYLVRKDLFSM